MAVKDIEELAERSGQQIKIYNIGSSNFKIDNNRWVLPNGEHIESNTDRLVYKVYRSKYYGVQGGDIIKIIGFNARDFAGKLNKRNNNK